MYTALCPRHTKRVLDNTVGFTLESVKTWRGLDARSAGTVAAVFLGIAIVIPSLVNPQTHRLEELKGAICGGDLDFIYTVDGAGSPAWGYPQHSLINVTLDPRETPWNRDRSESKALTFQDFVVDNVLSGEGRGECAFNLCYEEVPGEVIAVPRSDAARCCITKQTNVPNILAGTFSISVKAAENVAEANQIWNPGCLDIMDNATRYTNLIRASFGAAIVRGPTRIVCRDEWEGMDH